jgi:hypothetical protein
MKQVLQNTIVGLTFAALSGAAFSADFGDQRSGNPAHLVKSGAVTEIVDAKMETALNPGAYTHRSGAPITKVFVTRSASKGTAIGQLDTRLSPGAYQHRSGQV